MISQITDVNPLIEEAQLGQRLNKSVQQANYSDFSLLLSMLAEDVRTHSQFQLPHEDTVDRVVTTESLRKEFSLPPEQPMAIDELTTISSFDQAKLVESGQLSTLQLENLLKEKPLSFRDDKNFIKTNIIENTNLLCQLKHTLKNSEFKQNKLFFDAKEWLKSVQNAAVNSPFYEKTT